MICIPHKWEMTEAAVRIEGRQYAHGRESCVRDEYTCLKCGEKVYALFTPCNYQFLLWLGLMVVIIGGVMAYALI